MTKYIKILFIVLGSILFAISAFMLFEPSTDPTGFFTYMPNIEVINSENAVQLNSNLDIEFITSGTKDLTITKINGNMQFVGLRCGTQKLDILTANEAIEYEDYACKETSFLTVKVLSTELDLDIKFGGNMQQVKNIVPSIS